MVIDNGQINKDRIIVFDINNFDFQGAIIILFLC